MHSTYTPEMWKYYGSSEVSGVYTEFESGPTSGCYETESGSISRIIDTTFGLFKGGTGRKRAYNCATSLNWIFRPLEACLLSSN